MCYVHSFEASAIKAWKKRQNGDLSHLGVISPQMTQINLAIVLSN